MSAWGTTVITVQTRSWSVFSKVNSIILFASFRVWKYERLIITYTYTYIYIWEGERNNSQVINLSIYIKLRCIRGARRIFYFLSFNSHVFLILLTSLSWILIFCIFCNVVLKFQWIASSYAQKKRKQIHWTCHFERSRDDAFYKIELCCEDMKYFRKCKVFPWL